MNVTELKGKVAEFGRLYKWAKDAEEMCLCIESLEQTAKETEERVKKAKAQEAAIVAEHDLSRKAIADAKAEAAEIIKAANQKALDLVASELNKITGQKDEAAADLKAANESLAEALDKAKTAEVNYAVLLDETRKAKAELKELQDKKAEILAVFSK